MKRAQEAAAGAAEQTKRAAEQAKIKAGEVAAAANRTASDPETQARFDRGITGARGAVGKAKKGFATVIERIDPSVLADLIVKATALQERTNDSLRKKGSVYRVSEIAIQASIPPGVTFSITRIGEPEELLTGAEELSADLVETATDDETVLALDGSVADEEPAE